MCFQSEKTVFKFLVWTEPNTRKVIKRKKEHGILTCGDTNDNSEHKKDFRWQYPEVARLRMFIQFVCP